MDLDEFVAICVKSHFNGMDLFSLMIKNDPQSKRVFQQITVAKECERIELLTAVSIANLGDSSLVKQYREAVKRMKRATNGNVLNRFRVPIGEHNG